MQPWLSKRIAPLSLAPAVLLTAFILYSFIDSYERLQVAKLTKTASEL